MSYASVAAHNAPPPSEQPHADPALLYTAEDAAADAEEVQNVSDDASKVNLVPSDFKVHPETVTSTAPVIEQYPTPPPPKTASPPPNKVEKAEAKSEAKSEAKAKAKETLRSLEDKTEHALHEAEEEGLYLWQLFRENVLRPGVAGGLIGVVNLGLIGAASYTFYTEPRFRRDTRVIGSVVGSAVALLGAEGYAASVYRNTPRGREEERKARREGAILYKHSREIILRPGVFGGLVGLANIGILGGVAYAAYDNWNRPWDRRYVSAVTVGLLGLFGGEGYVAEQIREGSIQTPRR